MNYIDHRRFWTALAVFILGGWAPASFAASWIVPAGDWNTAANWSGSAVPNSATPAIIDNGGLVSLTRKSVKAASLYVGFATPVSGTATPPVPGSGTGAVSFLGGSLAVNSTVLGNAPSTSGELMLTRGNLTNTNDVVIGNSGTGVLGMSGGTLLNSSAYLGMSPGSLGTATISGGHWKNSHGLVVGQSGTGVLTVADQGVVAITGGNKVLGLANGAESSGTLNIGLGNLAGTLQVAGVHGGGGVATVNFNHTGMTVFAPNLTGSVVLNKYGIGTTVLTGTNSYTGPTTIYSGTLQIGNGSTKGTLGAGAVMNDSFLTFNRSGTLNVANAISGTGALRQLGSGLTILSGSNTYSGPTTVSNGVLQIDANSRLGSGELILDGGSLRFGAAFNDLRSFTVGTSGGTLDTGGFDVVFSGTAGGNGGFTKAGAGRLVLTGPLTYAGTTTVSGGILQVGNGTSDTTWGTGKIVNNGVIDFYLAADAPINSLISGKGQLVKSGSNRLTLNGANSYSGGTLVSAGVLQLGHAKALGASSGVLSLSGGELDLYGNSVTVGALSGSSGQITSSFPGATVTLTVQGATSGQYAGTLTDGNGTLALAKLGSGTLILSGSNSYSGGTQLSGGQIDVNHPNAFGTGAITISGPVTLDNTSGDAVVLSADNSFLWKSNFSFKGSAPMDLGTGAVTMTGARTITVLSNTLTVGGAIAGSSASHGLTKSGGGTLLLTGDNPYTGATVIRSGTLQIGDGGTSGSLSSSKVTITKGALVFERSDDISVDATLSGAGALHQAGTGRLVLTRANSYKGGTIVTEGELEIGNSKALGLGSLDLQNGLLDLNGYSVAITSLAGLGGAEITNSSAIPASLTTKTTGTSAYWGRITDGAGSVALAVSGKGVLVLGGNNSFSGGITLTSSELHLASAQALGSGTLIISKGVIDNVTGNALTLATNNPQRWDGDWVFKGSQDLDLGTGELTLKGTRTVTVQAGTLSVGGGVGGAGSSTGLKKAGAGVLILDGDNTYEGVTTINQGQLQIGRGGPTAFASRAVVNNGELVFNASNDLYYRGVISGKGSLRHVGGGLLFLSGVNTYSGGTVIEDGILRTGNLKALGSPTGRLAIFETGGLELNGGAVHIGTLSGAGTIANYGNVPVTLTTTSAETTTFAGTISDQSPSDPLAAVFTLVKAGTGTLILTGTNTYSGGTVVSGGTLQLGNGGLSGSIGGDVQNDGTLVFVHQSNQTFNGLISGKGSVRQLGLGNVVTLTADNTYSGGTVIGAASTLRLVDGGGIGTGSVENNGAFVIDVNLDRSLPNVLKGTGSLVKDGTGLLTLQGANTYSGGTIVNGGGIRLDQAKALGSTSGDLAVHDGLLDLNGFGLAVRTFSGSGAGGVITNSAAKDVVLSTTMNVSGTFAGRIEDGLIARTGLVKSGTGTLVLTGNSTYTGGTTIHSGTLQVGNGGTTGSLTGGITNKGALLFARSDEYTFSQPITGSGMVIQAGPGTLVLTGSNSFTGGTRLQGGTLKVGHEFALGTGPLTLSSGLLATDGNTSLLHVRGNLVWNSAAVVELTLTGDAFSERVLVDGQIVLEGNTSLVFSLNPSSLAVPGSFLLMTVAGGFNGLTPANFSYISDDPGFEGSFRIDGGNLWFDQNVSLLSFAALNLHAVPEPSSWTLLAAAAGALFGCRFRRKSS